ncbi:uncharacterized protein LOC122149381 [Catharus ustulatus]|uniref:uncharacterized protein LOC122149381 n=1 Tax=Catharus ustulatus TaxID=91951 RepID=UPI001C5B7626|nr:uncharacterized protein LOC122149381 [Catharus ustulatus]
MAFSSCRSPRQCPRSSSTATSRCYRSGASPGPGEHRAGPAGTLLSAPARSLPPSIPALFLLQEERVCSPCPKRRGRAARRGERLTKEGGEGKNLVPVPAAPGGTPDAPVEFGEQLRSEPGPPPGEPIPVAEVYKISAGAGRGSRQRGQSRTRLRPLKSPQGLLGASEGFCFHSLAGRALGNTKEPTGNTSASSSRAWTPDTTVTIGEHQGRGWHHPKDTDWMILSSLAGSAIP